MLFFAFLRCLASSLLYFDMIVSDFETEFAHVLRVCIDKTETPWRLCTSLELLFELNSYTALTLASEKII